MGLGILRGIMNSQKPVNPFCSRKVLVVVIATLFAAVCALVAQQRFNLTMSAVMTNDEFKASGIGSLSPVQRAALDQWLNRYTLHVFQVATKVADQAVPAGGSKCTPTIETTISGEFNGWEGETIFKLSNGQIWQQAEYDYNYSYSYMPEVTIYSTQGGCKMKVEDEEDTILVKRLK